MKSGIRSMLYLSSEQSRETELEYIERRLQLAKTPGL